MVATCGLAQVRAAVFFRAPNEILMWAVGSKLLKGGVRRDYTGLL